jgi:SAM-dependent methyltransferase
MASVRESVRRHFPSLLAAFKFLRSAAFRAEMRSGTVFPLHLPELDVELSATPEQLSRMLARIEETWTHLGFARPHFSVLTEKEFLPGNIDSSIDRFWASGDVDASVATNILSRYGFNDLAQKTCVEYGCGVGRVTIPLAARFAEVIAYDVSPTHLGLARQRASDMAVENIRFHRCAEGVPDRLESCDFFYSRLVFQHNPPPIIRELIRRALGSLRSGGIAIFGVPTYISGYRFRIDEYLALPQPKRMEEHCIPQREVFSLIAAAQCSVIGVGAERTIRRSAEVLGNLFAVRRPAQP